MTRPLLTVAVPTYNRCGCLELCLSVLLPQVQAAGADVELLVSDNASTDGTRAFVESLQAGGAPLAYLRNESNVGADRNFVQCFQRAQGEYLLLLGDDDVLLDGALARILGVLRDRQAGVVHLKGYSFQEDFRKEFPKRPGSGRIQVLTDPRAFADRVNINLTFISGNVVHRALVQDRVDLEACLDTNLVQLAWVLPAALAAPANVVIDEYLVAAKAENTGGYRLCQVFGLNLHAICQRFAAQGLDPVFFRRILRKALTNFFPAWILKLRKKGGDFHAEDPFDTLRPVFGARPAFWFMVWPAARWPRGLARLWLKVCKNGLKLVHQW